MITLLRELGCTVLPHVPDRMTEGYGPNAPALQALVARGATLIVCVDCGTAAARGAGRAARPGGRDRARPPQEPRGRRRRSWRRSIRTGWIAAPA